ncbi:MAG: MmcQ/YjbR family DNA-binding protein [Bacillota bacterium]
MKHRAAWKIERMPRKKLGFNAVRDIAMALPGVQESTLHGVPSLKLGGKLLACPALHKSADSESLVVRISLPERAQLMSDKPDTYYLTPHYSKYPMVLVRLSRIDRASLRGLLQRSWSFADGKTGTASSKPRKAKRRSSSR